MLQKPSTKSRARRESAEGEKEREDGKRGAGWNEERETRRRRRRRRRRRGKWGERNSKYHGRNIQYGNEESKQRKIRKNGKGCQSSAEGLAARGGEGYRRDASEYGEGEYYDAQSGDEEEDKAYT